MVTILIDNQVRNQLRRIGHKHQTYNDIIKQLLEKAKKSSANSDRTAMDEG
ncbi:hypothetical protein [Candidatus Nitrosocosmicus franklandus]|uniref:Uncharacterized protein n=1 Tax=Candidatus Nitrosocosmicus franklandianus TaxID=1798806 RepID=A0A484I8J3_9ARCH|nr:hypothetical protein [Candidatus Nitrosocosmicus franklandus]VFJ12604.1 protein of unknown function [Candidatus Nitrosocosmicus franklandus]